MPEYKKADIRHTIREDEFKKIIKHTPNARDRLFLSLLYCTGARPSEVAGDPEHNKKGMTFEDVEFDFEKGAVLFHVPVSKIQRGMYAVDKRQLMLEFEPGDPDYAVMVLIQSFNDMVERQRYIQVKKEIDPAVQIFDFCRKTGYNIVERAGKIIGTELCPYNFRHSRLTLLSEAGAGIETLMYFKGSRDIKSIANYLHARKVKFRLNKKKEDERRETEEGAVNSS